MNQAPGGPRLSAGQAQVVADVVGSARVLDVLVGAAGTGKSTPMAVLRQPRERRDGPGPRTAGGRPVRPRARRRCPAA